jgi:His/Glu/Gln/Arg/opine family amino acid ABC transporter permease subunit
LDSVQEPSLFEQVMPYLLKGAVVTVELSVVSMAIALIVGLIAALARLSRSRIARIVATIYVEVIRGTPLLVQLFIVYYGLPSYGIRLEAFTAGIITLGFHYGAYLSEAYRAGILSIDKGQWEAAASIGMTRIQIMRDIILRQAIRVILPTIGNYFISMLKDSALTATISLSELLREGQLRIAITFRAMDIYLMVAAIYLILSYPFSLMLRRLEAKASRGHGTQS